MFLTSEQITAVALTVSRYAIVALFSRIIAMGWLSPENATPLQNWMMDGLAFAVPAAIAYIGARIAARNNDPKRIVEKAAALDPKIKS